MNYTNTETRMTGGMKVVRKVSVKNRKGYKRITKYRRGKKVSDVKMPISPEHVDKICAGEFIRGLFKDCGNNKTRKNRRTH